MSLLYVRTAKTASSSVNAWMGPKTGSTFNQRFLTEPPNDLKVSKALEYNHYIFTTVRSPFTRAISCWQQSIRSSWIPKNDIFWILFSIKILVKLPILIIKLMSFLWLNILNLTCVILIKLLK